MPKPTTLTKAAIVESVTQHVDGFTTKEAAHIVETVFELLKQTLVNGEKIKLCGFGGFVVRDKHSRLGRNPRTGAPLRISGRRVIKFKPSQVLKEALSR